eukprot:TRINITY_DN49328_c0_g1_i1.p1 TRINITY_DN49328_c0_g1~~TRINITY_DN49328_c0_g1_i1.p1  ORF type:complete len:251 (+),score=49.15 TRINITY_DN49328_c0_g1_i1:32-754(+)
MAYLRVWARLRPGLVPVRGARHGLRGFRAFGADAAPSAAAGTPGVCPSCGAPQPETLALVCPACGRLASMERKATSHYELLGLAPEFQVNPAKVDTAYKDLQRLLHPDRHATSSEEQRGLAASHSAKLNEAVRVLRSPLLRAHHWMELHGVRVLQEDQRIEDTSTLMEVMEMSEEIAEATTRAEIDELAERIVQKMSAVEEQLSEVFRREDWDAARPLIERLQMLSRLHERANDWQAPTE